MKQDNSLRQPIIFTLDDEVSLKSSPNLNKSKKNEPILHNPQNYNFHSHNPYAKHLNNNKIIRFVYQPSPNPQDNLQIDHFRQLNIPLAQNNHKNQLKNILAESLKNSYIFNQQQYAITHSNRNQSNMKTKQIIRQPMLQSRETVYSKNYYDTLKNSNTRVNAIFEMNSSDRIKSTHRAQSTRPNLEKGNMACKRGHSNNISCNQQMSLAASKELGQRKSDSNMMESTQIQDSRINNFSTAFQLKYQPRKTLFFQQNKDKFNKIKRSTQNISSSSSETNKVQYIKASVPKWNNINYAINSWERTAEISSEKQKSNISNSANRNISKEQLQISSLSQQISSLKQVLKQQKSTKQEQHRVRVEYYNRFQALQYQLIEQKRKRKQQKQLYEFKAAVQQIKFNACLDQMKQKKQILKQQNNNLVDQLSMKQQLLKLQSMEISRLQQIIMNEIV